jgi:cell division protein FtsW
MALGSGGILGKGLAKGQMKLLYLPEAHTDFIFPIIGEELGFIGALLVIALFLLFAWRGMRIGYESKDLFGGMLAIGITLIIAFQALINMGVACGVLPTKGLPLPFVSFGGTALVIYMASVGVLLNVSARR